MEWQRSSRSSSVRYSASPSPPEVSRRRSRPGIATLAGVGGLERHGEAREPRVRVSGPRRERHCFQALRCLRAPAKSVSGSFRVSLHSNLPHFRGTDTDRSTRGRSRRYWPKRRVINVSLRPRFGGFFLRASVPRWVSPNSGGPIGFFRLRCAWSNRSQRSNAALIRAQTSGYLRAYTSVSRRSMTSTPRVWCRCSAAPAKIDTLSKSKRGRLPNRDTAELLRVHPRAIEALIG